MLHQCACFCAGKLLHHTSISLSRKPVFVYGFELFFSTFFSLSTILILSLLFQAVIETLFFLLPFFGLRLFCGGYHAKTYSRCFISTNFTYLLTLCGAKLISFLSTMSFMLFFACLAFLIIFFWSPIRNYRHPLSEKRYQHNRKIARLLSILYVSLSFIFYSTFSGMIFLMFTLSGMAVAILMIKPKLQERRK